MLTFHNPGELDMRLAVTLGTNVKESENPIGYFGTGLKYAIAKLTAAGAQFVIWSGETPYTFRMESEVIRRKSFDFILMESPNAAPMRLGFTTEFGKGWEWWHVYRELWCNAKDEGGGVVVGERAPTRGSTTIHVEHAALQTAYEQRRKYFFEPTEQPLASACGVDIYPGPSRGVFYKGVRVFESTERPCNFTYNVTGRSLTLSEDRKADFWSIAVIIRNALWESLSCMEEAVTEVGTLEQATLDWDWASTPGNVLEAMYEVYRKHPVSTAKSLANCVIRWKIERDGKIEYVEYKPEGKEIRVFQEAIATMGRMGYDLSPYTIQIADTLGQNCLGAALRSNKAIWLAKSLLGQPSRLLETLLEEYYHLAWTVDDETRAFQDRLIREVIRMSGLGAAASAPVRGLYAPDDLPF